MGRRAVPFWDKREQAYRTGIGGRTRYFRGIARDDHAGIAVAFAAHLAEVQVTLKPVELTAEDVATSYLGAARGVRSRTVRTHRERLIVWMEWDPGDGAGIIGARAASSLEAKHLRKALKDWKSGGRSDNYVAGIARSVKAAFAWAATEDAGRLVAANPFAEVKVPSIGRSPVRYAERREVAAFLRFAWRRLAAKEGPARLFGRMLVLLIRVALHTGARPGEISSAWWTDFDPVKGTITLPPDRHKTGGKTGKKRTIFLTPILVRAILRLQARPKRHPISIFCHQRTKAGIAKGVEAETGEPYGWFTELPNGAMSFETDGGTLTHRIREIRKCAIAECARLKAEGKPTRGLELIKAKDENRFVLYRLRHTVASDHLMNDGNASTVAELLGTSPRMLETTYGHLLDDHLAKAASELANRRRSRGRD